MGVSAECRQFLLFRALSECTGFAASASEGFDGDDAADGYAGWFDLCVDPPGHSRIVFNGDHSPFVGQAIY